MTDGFTDNTDDNQRSDPDMIKSSVKNFLRRKLDLGCIFRGAHAVMLYAVFFFVCYREMGFFKSLRKLFLY